MNEASSAFRQAASVLPEPLRRAAESLPEESRRYAEEFRLRCGRPMSVLLRGEEEVLSGTEVSQEDLRTVLGKGSGYSVHSVYGQLCGGFLTLRGGHRMGICGEGTMKDGTLCGVRTVSSVAIRIAKAVETAGESLPETLADERGRVRSTLVLAPPGAGKTTLLRDLIRRVSDGIGVRACRVGVADERGELAALWDGRAQFDLGRRTDVMSDCPKAKAVQILVRGMNPQVIAMDEITAEEDLDALLWAAGCGVTLLATAHGESRESLSQRPLYRRLLDAGVFSKLVVIEQREGVRRVQAGDLPPCV